MTEPKARITITIDEGLLERLRRTVASSEDQSVSAYVERAVASQLDAERDFESMIDEMLAESGGPLRPDELDAIHRVLDGSGPLTAEEAEALAQIDARRR